MGRLERFMKKRGLLLAAGLCVVAAGAAGIGAINGLIDTLGSEQRAPAQEPNKAQEDSTAWQMEEIVSFWGGHRKDFLLREKFRSVR